MQNTTTLLDSKARKAVLDGVNAIYEPVRRTFGPQGRNALLYGTYGREPRITNDGWTVAGCQKPKNVITRLASQEFRESCKKTNEKVGDGTTCTTIIGGKLFNDVYHRTTGSHEGLSSKNKNIGVVTLKKNIMETAKKVMEEIKKSAKKITTKEELEKIAIVSVEDEKIGKIIADIAWKVGTDSYIDVIEGHKGKLETEVIEGMRFPAKVPAKGFVNNPKRFEMVAEDVHVIMTNYKLDNKQQLIDFIAPLLDGKYPKIALFAPGFSEEVLKAIYNTSYPTQMSPQGVMTRTKGNHDVFPIHVPSLRTEQLEDLAINSGATLIDKNKGQLLTSIAEKDLGFFEKIIVKDVDAKEDAIALGGRGTKKTIVKEEEKKAGFDKEESKIEKREKTPVEERIETLKGQLEETKDERFKQLMKRRIASIASSVGIIKVGAPTRAQEYYLKLKIEDAQYACLSALKSGYVKGGGLCLKEIADKLPDTDILKPALLAPYEQIKFSIEGELKVGDEIIDPADAVYYAVLHATEVVANLATVDIVIPEIEPVEMGDSIMHISKILTELVINDKFQKGIIKENEREMERDSMGGLNKYEFLTTSED